MSYQNKPVDKQNYYLLYNISIENGILLGIILDFLCLYLLLKCENRSPYTPHGVIALAFDRILEHYSHDRAKNRI